MAKATVMRLSGTPFQAPRAAATFASFTPPNSHPPALAPPLTLVLPKFVLHLPDWRVADSRFEILCLEYLLKSKILSWLTYQLDLIVSSIFHCSIQLGAGARLGVGDRRGRPRRKGRTPARRAARSVGRANTSPATSVYHQGFDIDQFLHFPRISHCNITCT